MRNAILFFAIVLFAMACDNSGSSDRVVVKGTLDNADQQTIYLTVVDGQNPVNIDSVTVGADGAYQLEATFETARFLYIGQINQRNFVQLIAHPGDEITLNADMESMTSSYDVSGSEESQMIKQLNSQLTEAQNSIDSLRMAFEANKTELEGDQEALMALQQANQAAIQQHVDAYMEKKKTFIEENEGELATIVALSGLPIDQHFDLYKSVDEALMKKYADVPQVAEFHNFIANRTKEIENQNQRASQLAVGKVPPDFTLENADGEEVTLSDLKGKFVLLDFWASWCEPCRRENPNLVDAYNNYNSEGFEILQVSVDRGQEEWIEAIEADKISAWYHVHDNDNSVAQMYNIQAIPTNFLLNKEGEIIEKNLRGAALEEKLNELF